MLLLVFDLILLFVLSPILICNSLFLFVSLKIISANFHRFNDLIFVFGCFKENTNFTLPYAISIWMYAYHSVDFFFRFAKFFHFLKIF